MPSQPACVSEKTLRLVMYRGPARAHIVSRRTGCAPTYRLNKGATMTKFEQDIYADKGRDKGAAPMLRKVAGVLGFAVILTLFGAPSAKSADDGVPFPSGLR